ncbi:hypothetical protein Poli38472_002621 [Pythium oligandrum]|uniref:Uncharacterized protein n=1 Tax=Pythium oligandrum TaxID=41045 RepID=A0A8K1CJ65_PYTOL|nr:hypothetical protein Poli38472_002621 [Pythium oligandrum]|eukprot:TMW63680.1 hypothetical protein Poli38472_002621 [Pythium oligandrum]
MEVPRIIHDELLHGLEEPREEALKHAVEALEHGAHVLESPVTKTAELASKAPSESTPLLMAGTHIVAVDDDLDLRVLAIKLSEEERVVIEEDAKTPAKTIVKEELVHLLTMSPPLMLALLMEQIPDTISNMMAGRTDAIRSTEILAAFSLAGLFQALVVTPFVYGVASAMDTVCSQAYGGKRYREMWMFVQAGSIMFAACLPFIALIMADGKPILVALGQDSVISTTTQDINLITLIALPFQAIFTIQKSALQAQNIVSPFAISALAAWAISLPTGYILGFYTPLGYTGVVISTIVLSVLKAVFLFPVVWRNPIFREHWPGWRLREAFQLLPKIMHLGVSSVLMVTFQMIGFTVISLLAGLLPNPAITMSANSIFGSALSLTLMPLLGVCVAGAIRMGNALGSGQAHRAAVMAHVTVVSCVVVSTLITVSIILGAERFAHLFTTNVEAVTESLKLLYRLTPIIFMLGFVFGLQSIFRACGKQWLCAQLNFVFMFLLAVPLGIFFAMDLNEGVIGLWYGFGIGMLALIGSSSVWFARMRWEDMAQAARRTTQLHVEEPRAAEAF